MPARYARAYQERRCGRAQHGRGGRIGEPRAHKGGKYAQKQRRRCQAGGGVQVRGPAAAKQRKAQRRGGQPQERELEHRKPGDARHGGGKQAQRPHQQRMQMEMRQRRAHALKAQKRPHNQKVVRVLIAKIGDAAENEEKRKRQQRRSPQRPSPGKPFHPPGLPSSMLLLYYPNLGKLAIIISQPL